MADGELDHVVGQQMTALRERYPGLQALRQRNGTYLVCGMLGFCASYEGRTIETEYCVELAIPRDYPASPPAAKEIGGRISGGFHHMGDGSLCLGAPLEVRTKFASHPSLLGFVEGQLVPFLFAHSCFEQDGNMPFGELSHGPQGILEWYKELFDVDEDVTALELLKMAVDDNYKGHTLCPCGSGLRLRNCHGPRLRSIMGSQSRGQFLAEHLAMLLHMCKHDPSLDPNALVARGLRRKRRRG